MKKAGGFQEAKRGSRSRAKNHWRTGGAASPRRAIRGGSFGGLCAAMLGVVLLGPSRVTAFEARDLLAFKAGPVVIRPHLNLSEQYSDNITYVGGDFFPRESDFITIISPGFGATLGAQETGKLFTLNYGLDSLLYAQNSRFNALNHNLDVSATFSGHRIKSTTTGHAGFLSSILTGQERFSEGILLPRGKVDRIPYSFSSTLDYAVTAKTSAYLRGSFNGIQYSDNNPWFYDRSDWRVALGGTYAMGPKWRFLTEGYYGQSIYNASSSLRRSQPNWDRYGGNVGVTSSVTERLSGTAKVGYEYYDRGNGDGNTFTANIGLNYHLGQRTTFTLNFNRSARQSVSVGNESYITYSGGLGVQHQLGTKHPFTVGANVHGGLNDRDRGQETYVTAGVNGSYLVKSWFRILLAYQFESRSGNSYAVRDYTVNTVTLTAALGY